MIKVERDKNLKSYNTYNLDIESKYFLTLSSWKCEDEIQEVFDFIKENKIKKYFILGSGANIIFKHKKYNGAIIKIIKKNIEEIKGNSFRVSAGLEWDKFLNFLQKKAEKENKILFYDIQLLSSIPGTIGAAAFGNIGAFGMEVKRYIREVEYFDIEKNEIKKRSFKDLEYSYRNSYFKKNKNKFLILSVVFDFSRKFSQEIKNFYNNNEYFSFGHFIKKHKLGKIRKNKIRENIVKIRKNIYPDIKKYPNVGSTFKNTEVSKKDFKRIQRKYSDIPYWYLENGKIKIPTAFIFDKILGLNGKEFGAIKIHKTRPLFFINKGGTTGKEFFNLCQKIKKDIKKQWGIDLEEEVVFVE